jgi:transposase
LADQEAAMAKAYDMDLRLRVVGAIEAGASTEAAADRFDIGKATAGAWARLKRATGAVTPGRQGKPKGSKLDPHADFILGLVEAAPDITLAEIAGRLIAERGVRAVPATIWYFFDKRGITYKKRPRTPPSKSAKTSPPRAKPGSTAKSTSIPRA